MHLIKQYHCRWIFDNYNKIWDTQPMCRGPGNLGGVGLKDVSFIDLCEGQWASLMNLAPRIPIRQITDSDKEHQQYISKINT